MLTTDDIRTGVLVPWEQLAGLDKFGLRFPNLENDQRIVFPGKIGEEFYNSGTGYYLA